MQLIWTRKQPAVPGAYWVRRFDLGRPTDAALVEVRLCAGRLRCNLHAVNSDVEDEMFRLLRLFSASFEWCGPLVPAAAEQASAEHAI